MIGLAEKVPRVVALVVDLVARNCAASVPGIVGRELPPPVAGGVTVDLHPRHELPAGCARIGAVALLRRHASIVGAAWQADRRRAERSVDRHTPVQDRTWIARTQREASRKVPLDQQTIGLDVVGDTGIEPVTPAV